MAGTERRAPRYVYFIQADTLGFIKIGVAYDLANRFSALRTGNADTLTVLGVIYEPDACGLEKMLHHHFRAHHHHGEWYSPCDELVDFIKRNAVSQGEAHHHLTLAICEKVQRLAEAASPLPPQP